MKKSLLKKIAIITSTSVLTIVAACLIGSKSSKVYGLGFDAAQSYVCGDVTFGESVGSPNSSTDLTTKASLDKVCTYSTVVPGTSFTLTGFTNANYQNKNSEGTYYAVKIGGSKGSKYAGSFTLNLTGYTCERAIIYATGWAGDSNSALSVNSSEEQEITSTEKGGTYTFSPYNFESINSSSLTIANKTGVSSSCRIVISKIVLRLRSVA